MSNQSIIEHKANMFYVEFREDYLAICLACTYKKPAKGKSKASPYCKALILSISEGWTNDKRSKGADLSFYMTYPQWIESMYGMFGRNVVIDSIDELIGEGLLSREPVKYKSKDTFRYTLSHAEINTRMKTLPDCAPYNTRPQVNALISKRDDKSTGLQVNGMAFTNQRDTSLQVNGNGLKSKRNIESTYHPYTESAQNTESAYSAGNSEPATSDANASTHAPSQDEPYRPDFTASQARSEQDSVTAPELSTSIPPSGKVVHAVTQPSSKVVPSRNIYLPPRTAQVSKPQLTLLGGQVRDWYDTIRAGRTRLTAKNVEAFNTLGDLDGMNFVNLKETIETIEEQELVKKKSIPVDPQALASEDGYWRFDKWYPVVVRNRAKQQASQPSASGQPPRTSASLPSYAGMSDKEYYARLRGGTR